MSIIDMLDVPSYVMYVLDDTNNDVNAAIESVRREWSTCKNRKSNVNMFYRNVIKTLQEMNND